MNFKHPLWLRKDKNKFPMVIGVIGDTHIKFEHPNYLQFCIDKFIEWNVTHIIHIGDLVDFHYISRHQTHPEALSGEEEIKQTIEHLKDWTKIFPEMTITIGNHTRIPYRQLATLGLSKRYIKDLHEILELPHTWKFVKKIIMNGVLFEHGEGYGGLHGAYNGMLKQMQSVCIGHRHTDSSIKYHATETGLNFGMAVGTGIDYEKYAFEYQDKNIKKPILSVGIIKSSSEGYICPMTDNYLRSNKE